MAIRRWKNIRAGWSTILDESRIRLARPDALFPLALLGLVTGLLAGGVIVVFRLFVEGVQDGLLPGQGAESYEALDWWARLLFPLLGAVLLAVMFRRFAQGVHVLGIARVMERMAYHQGRCTPRAFLLQFFGAAIAIVGGHSVGREGPHVFLGASAGSLLGQHLSLPNNVIRALVGCGTAAGIAASFNTPLAGVVFALEVVMMEYTVASFIPVILAAVSATTLTRVVFGEHPAFSLPLLEMGSLSDLFLVVVLGVLAGAVSAVFIQTVQTVAERSSGIPIWWRMPLAGIFVGVVALWLPQVMGIGYDSVDQALHGGFAVPFLVMLLVGKLLATAACIGLGVPGGMIGPSLFAGAVLGALTAEVALLLPFGPESQVGFFALLGMGAMMSGSLQAPLAALTAMLELTDNPEIILPGMLAVVVAGITASEVFGKQSLFVAMLRSSGLDYDASPVFQALRRIGVASAMERRFARVESRIDVAVAREILQQKPEYLVIGSGGEPLVLMPAAELARHLESLPDGGEAGEVVDLLEIPGDRLQPGRLDLQANLEEAWRRFDQDAVDALLIERMSAPGIVRIYGILTPDKVEKAYRP
jgi:H+/Cl- antiporter ClcA